ncbi:hypothetical protein FQN57_000732 [Myotisia sp. PD_48]|nr:hypothetical protein FQN57_000732 [Myotisia sp. PD_48]
MEKHRDMGTIPPPVPQQQRRRQGWTSSLFRRCLVAVCICLALFSLFHRHHIPQKYVDRVNTKIPLEIHIMSKCPDAQACLQKLIVPTMEKVSDKVDFRISFIGSASPNSSSVACLHGPGECIGNLLILCAANLPYPPREPEDTTTKLTTSFKTTPTVRYLGFTNCMISQYKKIPSRALVEDCALEYGISFKALNACGSRQNDEGEGFNQDNDHYDDNDPNQPSGLALLRKSFKRSAELGVTKSCTVRLDKKTWCIRDGGEWTSCGDGNERSSVPALKTEIERLWKERN